VSCKAITSAQLWGHLYRQAARCQ